MVLVSMGIITLENFNGFSLRFNQVWRKIQTSEFCTKKEFKRFFFVFFFCKKCKSF